MAAPASETTSTDLNLVPLDMLARFHGASRLPLATAMYLGANIARAVAEHHDRGEVLGTLDANRIRCSHQGQVVIAPDGGSAMAPEVKRGEPPDVLFDIYAVGAIIYRLLTGMTPLQAMTRQPVSRLHQVPAPSALIPGVDPNLDEVLLSALATDPGERPISARIICRTIESIFADLELIASPSGVVRAVAATDSRRMKRPENWAAEYTKPGIPLGTVPKSRGQGRTETNSVIVTAVEDVEAPTIDLDSVIVSPSLCESTSTESATVETAPGSTPVEPTRQLVPQVQNRTVLERPTRSQAAETPTQSLAPVREKTSLIYGHPFFRPDEEGDERDPAMDSGEATGDVVPFEETIQRVKHGAHFAGEVYGDARQRLRRKWRHASRGTRRWAMVAALGAATVLVLSGMLLARGSDASVEVAGDPDVQVAKRPAVRPVVVAAAPVAQGPVVVPRPTSVVLAPTPAPLAKSDPVLPSRPVVKEAAPVAKVSKARPVKLTKKQLAAKKKAAKRAALARRIHH